MPRKKNNIIDPNVNGQYQPDNLKNKVAITIPELNLTLLVLKTKLANTTIEEYKQNYINQYTSKTILP